MLDNFGSSHSSRLKRISSPKLLVRKNGPIPVYLPPKPTIQHLTNYLFIKDPLSFLLISQLSHSFKLYYLFNHSSFNLKSNFELSKFSQNFSNSLNSRNFLPASPLRGQLGTTTKWHHRPPDFKKKRKSQVAGQENHQISY